MKFSEELEEYDKFVNDYINKKEFIVDNFIDINKLKDESNFIKRKCIELLIKRIQINDLFDVRDSEVTELLKLFNNDNISIDLNNIADLDICTIAPTIDNCHSINEQVSISSTERVYNWLKETLIEYNKI